MDSVEQQIIETITGKILLIRMSFLDSLVKNERPPNSFLTEKVFSPKKFVTCKITLNNQFPINIFEPKKNLT